MPYEIQTPKVKKEFVNGTTNNHGQGITILFTLSGLYYIPIIRTTQIINNIFKDENDIKSVLVTINDRISTLFDEKFKIAQNLQ